jgi:hypothetical protein
MQTCDNPFHSTQWHRPATAFRHALHRGSGDQVPSDAFVVRLSPHGTALLYATYLGGTLDDSGGSIAIDRLGNAYIIGTTASYDFPSAACATRGGGGYTAITGGACQNQLTYDNHDAFVAALNPTGSVLRWSRYLGGAAEDSGGGIALTSAGALLVTGTAASAGYIGDDPRFPTTPGAFHPKFSPGPEDCSEAGSPDSHAACYEIAVQQPETFVSSLNGADGTLAYSTFLGQGASGGTAIAVGPSGTVAVAGGSYSPPHQGGYGFDAYTYEGGVTIIAAGILKGQH